MYRDLCVWVNLQACIDSIFTFNISFTIWLVLQMLLALNENASFLCVFSLFTWRWRRCCFLPQTSDTQSRLQRCFTSARVSLRYTQPSLCLFSVLFCFDSSCLFVCVSVCYSIIVASNGLLILFVSIPHPFICGHSFLCFLLISIILWDHNSTVVFFSEL